MQFRITKNYKQKNIFLYLLQKKIKKKKIKICLI